ncbi:hypothetical protein K0M31_003586 [Melipona bicolor]|uniref:Uncharacterized protein n=1 Tax=Melipona bicolor TaxID=60889 RepID=A0AA40G058_9HYME|nr:hypothetical protein K0M31_003586 [Melipona bicolor]
MPDYRQPLERDDLLPITSVAIEDVNQLRNSYESIHRVLTNEIFAVPLSSAVLLELVTSCLREGLVDIPSVRLLVAVFSSSSRFSLEKHWGTYHCAISRLVAEPVVHDTWLPNVTT